MKLGLEKQNLFLISCFDDLIFYFVYFLLLQLLSSAASPTYLYPGN